MSKTVRKVFLIIGTLVFCFVIWQLVFKDGGLIRTGYNAMEGVVNKQWAKIAGDGSSILPSWSSNAKTNGTAKEMDIN